MYLNTEKEQQLSEKQLIIFDEIQATFKILHIISDYIQMLQNTKTP